MGQGEKNQSFSLTALCSPSFSHVPFLTSPFSQKQSLSFPCIVLLVLISSTDTYSCPSFLTRFWLWVEYCRCSLNTASCCFFLDDLTRICPSFHYLAHPSPLTSLHCTSQGKSMCQCGKAPLLFCVPPSSPANSKTHIDPTTAEALKCRVFSHPYSSGNT